MYNTRSIVYTLTLFLITFNLSYAQRLEKIKGNKIVTTVSTKVTAFQTLDVDEDFEIDLMYSANPFVSITTDENLHEVIAFKVQDSILEFNNLKHITSKKALHIKVGYNNVLQYINAKNASKINSTTPLNFKKCNLDISGDAKVELTVSATHFHLKSADKSKVRLNLTADTTILNLKSISKIEALINTSKFSSYSYEKANAEIEGNCNTATIVLDNDTTFQGKNFTTNTCNITCDTSSKAALEVMDTVTLNASGSSAVYLYQNPKIIVEALTGTSKIQKKLK